MRQTETLNPARCAYCRNYVGSSKHRAGKEERQGSVGTVSSAGEDRVSSHQRGWVGRGSRWHLLLQPAACVGISGRPSREQGKAALILEALNLPLPTAEAEHTQRVRTWDDAAPGGLTRAVSLRREGLK